MRARFLIIILMMAFAVQARNPAYPDAGLWSTLNITYKLNKRWGLLFTQEVRLRENYSRLNLFYTNLGVIYSLNKRVKFGVIYRHIDKYLIDNTFSYRNRLMLDASYRLPFKRWQFTTRQRFQFEYRDFLTSELGKIPEMFSRTKFELSYDVTPKFSPYISTEFRVQLSDPRNSDDDDNLGRNRTIFGFDYDLNKRIKLGAYFLHQAEFNTVTPQIINIVGLQCGINLNQVLAKSKKKDKKAKDVK